MKFVLLFLIRFYQIIPTPFRGQCRFSPTCSQYCYKSIKSHGTISGLLMCAKRLVRCGPF